MTYDIKVRLVDRSNHLEDGVFAVTEWRDVNKFVIYVRNSPAWAESLAHELTHVFCGIVHEVCSFKDETLPRKVEDAVIKMIRKKIDEKEKKND